MKFTAKREDLLKPLNLVVGVVERRQTLPILANVLIELNSQQLSLTGTDLEVEIVGRVLLENPGESGAITVPARKLFDICKSLPDGSDINFSVSDNKAVVSCGRSRFSLSTLAANDFPNVEESPGSVEFKLLQGQLKHLIDATSFAMAQQDVRYYLNGMLWEVEQGKLATVATDGHRLALSANDELEINISEKKQVIVPRKGILELARLLMNETEEVMVVLGNNHVRATTADFTFTSKLVDGKFPDYQRVIPSQSHRNLVGNRVEIRQALSRTAILSNEKYRGVRLLLDDHNLKIMANNPEQEEAEENIGVDYTGGTLEIGFNVSYLIDVLNCVGSETVLFELSDANSSVIIREDATAQDLYVVMPMRL